MDNAYGVAIFLRPDGLGSGNNWPVGTFDDINESGRNDADFITSDPVRQNQQSTVIFSFSNDVDPFVDIDHVVRYTFKENGLSAAHSPSLEVTLQQGGTDLITWTESGPLPEVFTLSTREVPLSVVSQIGDYNDLRLKFRVFCQAGVTCNNTTPEETVSVSWAELQYETYTTPRSHPPPKIAGIGFYKIESTKQDTSEINLIKLANYSKQSDVTDPQIYGKYKKSGKFYEIGKPIPTFEGKINESIQTQIQLNGVFASNRIEHLSLFSTSTKSNFKSVNFEIIADKGKKPIVIDYNKFLKDVKSTYSLEDGNLWINLDLSFQKPLKSHIVLQAWDEQRIPVYAEIVDAWDISDPSKTISSIIETPDRVKVAITKKLNPNDCKENKSCYDPAEIKIRKGGSVVWKNEDAVIHTIVSGTPKKGPDGKFNFAIIPQHSSEKAFPFVGTYSYYCSIHPWYVGTVIVYDDPHKEAKTQQYVDFKLVTSGGIVITNEQTLILKDRNTGVYLSGHLPNVKKQMTVDVLIKKPDQSTENLSIKTTKDGYYSTSIQLTKKWQSGKFEIIGKHNGLEIGHLNFTITDKPFKSQKG